MSTLTDRTNTQSPGNVYAFECGVRGHDWSTVVRALTAGKAKYSYLLNVRDAWPDITFRDLTCRRLKTIPPTRTEIAQAEADSFNERYPVGTILDYWSWVKEGEPTGRAAIRHHATVVCDNAVIWLVGVASCQSISHMEPVV